MTTEDRNIGLKDAIVEARNGADLMIRCPAHDDGRPSLHVSPGTGKAGAVVLRCFADCTTAAIVAAGEVSMSDLFGDDTDAFSRPSTDRWTPQGEASHIYPYVDEHGTLLYEVMRVPLGGGGGKTFFQRTPDVTTKSGWSYKLGDTRRVLYRLPEVIKAVEAGQVIHLCEGEKDVEAVRDAGYVATTMPMGAGKWQPSYSEYLRGATVVILADADQPGRDHARAVRGYLGAVDCAVEIREPAAGQKDVSNVLSSGGKLEDMLITTPFDRTVRSKYGMDIHDVVLRKISDIEWVVPNMLAKRERILLTGFEGLGKSNLCRQFAACIAAGLNPFTFAHMDPKRVLFIDAENEPGQTLESWQGLLSRCDEYSAPIDRGQLTILEEWDNSDMDLASPVGMEWLHERIEAYKPDLCVIGPLTNAVGRDLKDDEPVRKLKSTVNSARTICGTSFLLEHHAPHRSQNEKKRSVRPYGSSMFLRWPDFGYGLLPTEDEGTYAWEKTRWPRVRTRAWPAFLKWGNQPAGDFPWVETEPPVGWGS